MKEAHGAKTFGAVTYRDARAEDAAELAAFSAQRFVETFAAMGHVYPTEDLAAFLAGKFSPAHQRAEIEDPAMRVRVAHAEGALIGYCMTGPYDMAPKPIDARALELHRLYVADAAKGRGVAQALMDDAMDWARAQGAQAMYLSVWEHNIRAQRFYRRYGFADFAEHAFMIGSIADRDFVWRRALTP